VVPVPAESEAYLPADWNGHTEPSADEPRYEIEVDAGWLPELAPAETSILPLEMLAAMTTGASRGRGGPVPIPDRVLWESILAVPPASRNHAAELRIKLHDLARSVWPATDRYSTGRHYEPLIRALYRVDSAGIRWRDAEGGLLRLVTVYRMPAIPDPAAEATIIVALPAASRQGPQVDRQLLRTLAARSARAHRLMLAAYCLWDLRATVNGRLIEPTLPRVMRDDAGYILDGRGRLVLERGRPCRRATHPRAVQTGGREPNPAAESAYPWLTGDDVILLAHPDLAPSAAGKRKQRARTLSTLEALRAIGALTFEASYAKVRLLPSADHVAAHRARWAANRHG